MVQGLGISGLESRRQEDCDKFKTKASSQPCREEGYIHSVEPGFN